jgi:transposase
MAHNDKTVSLALQDYLRGEMYTKEIAKKYEVSPSTITAWATTAGVKLRSRGRHKQVSPTIRQLKIIELAQVLKYEEVGRQFGITKQAVHRVLIRWKAFVKPKRAPFVPGDVISWRGQKFTVYTAGIDGGTLVDKKGKLVRCVVWNSAGRTPTKIGFDARYAEKSAKVAELAAAS